MLALGDRAPSALVQRQDGSSVELSTFWQQRPVVLTLLRHMGCNFCRAFLAQLRRAYPDIVDRHAAIVAVVQGTPLQVTHFTRSFNIPFPVLADPQRAAYAAFNLEEAGWLQTVNPSVAVQMVATAAHGHLPGMREHIDGLIGQGVSLRQTGGTFVIDPTGQLRYSHTATAIYKTPAVDELLGVLDALTP